MSLSEFFTDEDLESQLRLQFESEEQWDIDFKTIFNQIVDRGGDYYLNFRNREFSIDKLTGAVRDITGGALG